jgi:hypothetical protein
MFNTTGIFPPRRRSREIDFVIRAYDVAGSPSWGVTARVLPNCLLQTPSSPNVFLENFSASSAPSAFQIVSASSFRTRPRHRARGAEVAGDDFKEGGTSDATLDQLQITDSLDHCAGDRRVAARYRWNRGGLHGRRGAAWIGHVRRRHQHDVTDRARHMQTDVDVWQHATYA